MCLQRAAGTEADQLVANHIGQCQTPAPVQGRMIPAADDDQSVHREGVGLELAEIDGVGDDAGIGAPAGHGRHDLVARPLLEVDIDLRMGGEVGGQRLGQELGGRGRVGQQAHMALEPTRVRGEVAAHLLQLLDHQTGMMLQSLPRRCQPDAAALAPQQGGAEDGLHPADAGARRGQRQARRAPPRR